MDWLNANLEAYTARLAGRHDNRETRKAKLSRLRTFFYWLLGVKGTELRDWRDVTPTLIDEYCAHRLHSPPAHRWNNDHNEGRGVKGGTVGTDLAAVRRWLEFNEERELTGPIRSQYLRGRVEQPKSEDRFALDAAQTARVLELARLVAPRQQVLKYVDPSTGRLKWAWCKHWPAGAFHAFCRLGLELGLRPRELFWLHWSDFTAHGDKLVVEVRDHLVRVGGRDVFANRVKTPQSRRKLVVPQDLARELQDLRASLHAAGDVREFVFAQRDSRAACGWVKPDPAFIVKAIKHDLGEPRFRINSLRKTSGTSLRGSGADIRTVAAMLGHSPQTTMQHYVSETRDGQALDPTTGKAVNLDGQPQAAPRTPAAPPAPLPAPAPATIDTRPRRTWSIKCDDTGRATVSQIVTERKLPPRADVKLLACEVCGQQVRRRHGMQRYCQPCAAERKRAIRERANRKLRANPEYRARELARQRELERQRRKAGAGIGT